MPKKVSSISCFSQFDIACSFALRDLGYFGPPSPSDSTVRIMGAGTKLAERIEGYCRRSSFQLAWVSAKIWDIKRRRGS